MEGLTRHRYSFSYVDRWRDWPAIDCKIYVLDFLFRINWCALRLEELKLRKEGIKSPHSSTYILQSIAGQSLHLSTPTDQSTGRRKVKQIYFLDVHLSTPSKKFVFQRLDIVSKKISWPWLVWESYFWSHDMVSWNYHYNLTWFDNKKKRKKINP